MQAHADLQRSPGPGSGRPRGRQRGRQIARAPYQCLAMLSDVLPGQKTCESLTCGAPHIPWISSPGIPVRALAGLPVSRLNASSGDPDRLLAEVAHYPGCTYTGSSALLALAGPIGGAGGNLAPAHAQP